MDLRTIAYTYKMGIISKKSIKQENKKNDEIIYNKTRKLKRILKK